METRTRRQVSREASFHNRATSMIQHTVLENRRLGGSLGFQVVRRSHMGSVGVTQFICNNGQIKELVLR